MTISKEDIAVWEEFIHSIKPLKRKSNKKTPIVKEKLKIKQRPEKKISFILDLHGYTVQEAYDLSLKFISIHFFLKSKCITIITGKGISGEGKIKKEIALWFETPVFKKMISSFLWQNAGGTIKIELKQQRK